MDSSTSEVIRADQNPAELLSAEVEISQGRAKAQAAQTAKVNRIALSVGSVESCVTVLVACYGG